MNECKTPQVVINASKYTAMNLIKSPKMMGDYHCSSHLKAHKHWAKNVVLRIKVNCSEIRFTKSPKHDGHPKKKNH